MAKKRKTFKDTVHSAAVESMEPRFYPKNYSPEEQDQVDTKRAQEILGDMEQKRQEMGFESLEEAYQWARRADPSHQRLGPKRWAEAIRAKEALGEIKKRRSPNERGAMVDVDYDRGEEYLPKRP